MTPEQISEYFECRSNPLYFCKKYFKLSSFTTLEPQSFDVTERRTELMGSPLSSPVTILFGERQDGGSSSLAAYATWFSVFYPDRLTVLYAMDHNIAKDLMQKIAYAVRHLPEWITSLPTSLNQTQMKLPNGSNIRVMSRVDHMKGMLINLVLVDNPALIGEMEEFWRCAYPAVSMNTPIIMADLIENQHIVINSLPKSMNYRSII